MCNIKTRLCTACSKTDNRALSKEGYCDCDIFFVLKNGICVEDKSSPIHELEE